MKAKINSRAKLKQKQKITKRERKNQLSENKLFDRPIKKTTTTITIKNNLHKK